MLMLCLVWCGRLGRWQFGFRLLVFSECCVVVFIVLQGWFRCVVLKVVSWVLCFIFQNLCWCVLGVLNIQLWVIFDWQLWIWQLVLISIMLLFFSICVCFILCGKVLVVLNRMMQKVELGVFILWCVWWMNLVILVVLMFL